MSNRSFGKSNQNSAENRHNFQKLEVSTFNSIRKVLPDHAIEQACRETDYQFRHRLITPVVTVLHMVLAAIWPEDSFNAGWQVLWSAAAGKFTELAGHSPARGKVANARKRLPRQLWRKIFAWISQRGQELSQEYACWKDHRVVLVDGSCVSMPDEDELVREFGVNTGYHGKGKYPLARLVTLCLAQTMTVISYAVGGYTASEWALLKTRLNTLKEGDLLLGDRHFAAAHYYVSYQSLGLEYLTRAHQNLKVSRIKRLWSYSQNDFVGSLEVNKVYRKKDPTLPARVRVRFIQGAIQIRGKRQVAWFATSLLDNQTYPAAEIVGLYSKRWRVETLFKEVKINLSADVLRSKLAENIYKEIAARFVALNVVRMIALEAADQEGKVDPLRISFVHTLRTILVFSPVFCFEPLWKLPQIYEALLTEIASEIVPERSSRNEPRAVRRERQHYPSLKTTRE